MKRFLLMALLGFIASFGFSQSLINENFNKVTGIPEGWTIIDGGTNVGTWTWLSKYGLNDSPCLELDTYDKGNDPADDWLITPKIKVRNGDVLTFWVAGNNTYKDKISVKASKTGVAAADFTLELMPLTEVPGSTFSKMTVAVVGNATIADGDEIYIGIHCNTNESRVDIDDFRVGPEVLTNLAENFNAGEAAGWTILNPNGGKTWAWLSKYGVDNTACMDLDTYESGAPAADDWLITPMLQITKLNAVRFKMAADKAYPDKFSLKASKKGTAAEDFTIVIAENIEVNSADFKKFEYLLFTNPEFKEGDEIYLAFHCTSNGSYLDMDDFEFVPNALSLYETFDMGLPAAWTKIDGAKTKVLGPILFNRALTVLHRNIWILMKTDTNLPTIG